MAMTGQQIAQLVFAVVIVALLAAILGVAASKSMSSNGSGLSAMGGRSSLATVYRPSQAFVVDAATNGPLFDAAKNEPLKVSSLTTYDTAKNAWVVSKATKLANGAYSFSKPLSIDNATTRALQDPKLPERDVIVNGNTQMLVSGWDGQTLVLNARPLP